ncbi:MAG: helix-turn-helix domain-containing protein [Fimbriimonadaceae bacterium]|nr:helix-turn-helix domain-containing protein [Fimbriimonadaceae bacterium]
MTEHAGQPLTYDLAEAAERIGGVSERWLAAQLRDGKIPGRKVGRKWRMTAGDIDACLEIFKVGPQQSVPHRSADAREADQRPERGRKSAPRKSHSPGMKDEQFLLFP